MNDTDITKTLYALERPTSDEHIDQLNTTIGKYLDRCTGKLNYSFWNTVIYTYWNFINITKLCDKQYDSNEEDFIKKIRDIVRQKLISLPKLLVRQAAPVYTQVHQPVTTQTVVDESSSESDTDEPCENSPPYVPPTDNIPDEKSQSSIWFGATARRVASGVAAACIIFFVYKLYSNSQEY